MITFMHSHDDAEAAIYVPTTGDPDEWTITGWFVSSKDHRVRRYELHRKGSYLTASPNRHSLEMLANNLAGMKDRQLSTVLAQLNGHSLRKPSELTPAQRAEAELAGALTAELARRGDEYRAP